MNKRGGLRAPWDDLTEGGLCGATAGLCVILAKLCLKGFAACFMQLLLTGKK